MENLRLTLASMVLTIGVASAQTPEWGWATGFGTDGWDRAWGMAHDDIGNKYIIGLFDDDTMHIEDLVLSNPDAGYDAMFVCNYGPSDEAIWAISASGFSEQSKASIQLDENGDLLFSGTFHAGSLIFSNGVTLVNPSPGQSCGFRALCTPDGLVQSAEYTTNATSWTSGQLFDSDGNSYQTGWFSTPSITLGGETFNNQGMRDAYLVKRNDQGTVQWAIQFGSSGNDGAGIALDQVHGRVIVSGGFNGPSMSVGSQVLTNSGSGNDGFLASIGFDGTVLWAQDAACESQDGYSHVEIDGFGNIYLAGYFVWTPITFGTVIIQPGGGPIDWFLAKFDEAGTVLWADGGGGANADYITSLYLDEYGSAYISGIINTGDTLTFGGLSVAFQESPGVFLVKYDPSGEAVWIKGIRGRDYGGSFMDANGYIYLLSSFSDAIDLDGITVDAGPDDNYYDIVLARLDTLSTGTEEFYMVLRNVYPNPFSSSVTIEKIPGTTSVIITDLLGKEVHRFLPGGGNAAVWNGRTTSGTEVPSGIYFVTVIADGQRYTQRVVKQ